MFGNIGGVNFAKWGGGLKICRRLQTLLFTSVSLISLASFHLSLSDRLCFRRSLAIFFSAGSLALTHTNAPLVHLVSISLMSGALELSALTNDSPLYSHLPPLITHRRFVTGSPARWLSLSLARHRLVSRKKKKKICKESLFLQREKRRFTVGCPGKQWRRNITALLTRYKAVPRLKLHFAKREKSP